MKVILFAAFLFLGFMGYACCKVAGDADESSERMWTNERSKGKKEEKEE